MNATTGAQDLKPYTVDLWGSNPDTTDNDDCWTGESFSTRDEAVLAYRNVVMLPDHNQLVRGCGGDWEFVCIDGPDVHEVTANPDQPRQERHRRDRARSANEWKREQAMQAGMAFGCDGYNDEMGF
jgi:hypothetical protein